MRISVCLFCYMYVISIKLCWTWDFFEFLVGPKLGANTERTGRATLQQSVENLVQGYGYTFQEYSVTSETGHILSMHRIQKKKKRRLLDYSSKIVLIHHGLLASSDTWLFRGPDKDLPYILADAGYDVWLSNLRGNTYSRNHKTLDPDNNSEYWNFGLHEVGIYDLPAVIDYILQETKQRDLFYIGHSIGSTIALILCAMRPEYNKKIKLHIALAPIAFVVHDFGLFHTFLFDILNPFSQILISRNIYEVFPRRQYFSRIIEFICGDKMPTQKLCLAATFLFVGTDYQQLNSTMFPIAAKYYPAGTSLYLSMDLQQIFSKGIFGPMDYGNETVNMLHYNCTKPAEYNITQISHPVSIHFAEGDFLVTEKDVDILAKKLPNLVGKFRVPYPSFNHLDFIWAIDSKTLLYEQLIVLMNKHR